MVRKTVSPLSFGNLSSAATSTLPIYRVNHASRNSPFTKTKASSHILVDGSVLVDGAAIVSRANAALHRARSSPSIRRSNAIHGLAVRTASREPVHANRLASWGSVAKGRAYGGPCGMGCAGGDVLRILVDEAPSGIQFSLQCRSILPSNPKRLTPSIHRRIRLQGHRHESTYL